MSVVILGKFEIEKWKEALALRGVSLEVGPSGAAFLRVLVSDKDYAVWKVFMGGLTVSGILEALSMLDEFHQGEAVKSRGSVARGYGFERALQSLKEGMKVARKGWNGKGLWLEIQRPDVHSKMNLPYIFMSYPMDAKTTPGARVPWLASQTDMLAEDWILVD